MLKDLLQAGNTKGENKRGKEGKKMQKYKTVQKMAIGTYLLIITLNVKGLNGPTKDIDWLNEYKSKTHVSVVYIQ